MTDFLHRNIMFSGQWNNYSSQSSLKISQDSLLLLQSADQSTVSDENRKLHILDLLQQSTHLPKWKHHTNFKQNNDIFHLSENRSNQSDHINIEVKVILRVTEQNIRAAFPEIKKNQKFTRIIFKYHHIKIIWEDITFWRRGRIVIS